MEIAEDGQLGHEATIIGNESAEAEPDGGGFLMGDK